MKKLGIPVEDEETSSRGREGIEGQGLHSISHTSKAVRRNIWACSCASRRGFQLHHGPPSPREFKFT